MRDPIELRWDTIINSKVKEPGSKPKIKAVTNCGCITTKVCVKFRKKNVVNMIMHICLMFNLIVEVQGLNSLMGCFQVCLGALGRWIHAGHVRPRSSFTRHIWQWIHDLRLFLQIDGPHGSQFPPQRRHHGHTFCQHEVSSSNWRIFTYFQIYK